MLRKVLRYGVLSKNMYLTRKKAYTAKQSVHPLIGIRQQKLGVCQLNMPDNRNILTEQLTDELFRYFTSYHHEQTIQNVFLLSKAGVFSGGADFRELSRNPLYLDKLYRLSSLLSSIHKPVIAQVAGGVRGAAAAILAMIPGPIGFRNANLAYDEATRGFIPLCGGSFHLAQLPFGLGSYLALTGDTLDSDEMARLGILKHFVKDGVRNEDIIKRLCEANLFFREQLKATAADGQHPEGIKLARMAQKQIIVEEEERTRQEIIAGHPEHDMLHKMAKHQYSKVLFDYENAKTPYSSFSPKPYYSVLNYYALRLNRPLNYLHKHSLIDVAQFPQLRLPRLDLMRIERIFARPKYAEVVKALKEDPSDWAKDVYTALMSRDQLAMAITHKLIKQASSLSFVECFELEYRVARRLLAASTLDIRQTDIGSEYVFVSKLSALKGKQFENCVDTFFLEARTYEEKLQHGLASKALLPASQHYQQFSDAFRLYLNRENWTDRNAINYRRQTQRQLEQRKIDFRNPQFDVNILRERTYQRHLLLKKIQTQLKRVEYIAFHPNILEQYNKNRLQYLESFPKEKLKKKIDILLIKHFNKALENRTKGSESGANVLGLQKRKRLFQKARTLLLNNVLFNGSAIEMEMMKKDGFKGEIYFDANGKGIYDSVNPYLFDHQGTKKMTEQLKTGEVSQDFLDEFGEKETEASLGARVKEEKYEKERKSLMEKVAERYGEDLRLLPPLETYKQLIKRAAQTTSELSPLNDWSYSEAQYMTKGAGHVPRTYAKYAERVRLFIASETQEEHLKLIEIVKQQHKAKINLEIPKSSELKLRESFPYYFMQECLPTSLKGYFLKTLDGVVQHFTQVDPTTKTSFKSELKLVDDWVNTHIGLTYTEIIKDDVDFIASYLGLLIAKQILYFYENNKRKYKNPSDFAQALLQETGIEIEMPLIVSNVPLSELNEMIKNVRDEQSLTPEVDFPLMTTEEMGRVYEDAGKIQPSTKCPAYDQLQNQMQQFLTFMIDIHAETKLRISSPQAKLLQFINRLSLGLEKDEQFMTLSFESLMLLISKDRRKIYANVMKKEQPSEPQLLLSLAYRESKFNPKKDIVVENDEEKMEIQEKLRDYFINSANIKSPFGKKSLVSSYVYYMMLYDSMLARACANDHFLPTDYTLQSLKPFLTQLRTILPHTSNQKWMEEQLDSFVHTVLMHRLSVESRLSKGELTLIDQRSKWVFTPEIFRQYVEQQLQKEQKQILEIGIPEKKYMSEQDGFQYKYNVMRRQIKNEGALRRANQMMQAEGLVKAYNKDYNENMSKLQIADFKADQEFHSSPHDNRMPRETYARVESDVRAYPGELASTSYLLDEHKQFNSAYLSFTTTKIQKSHLSPFSAELIILNDAIKNDILVQITQKLRIIAQI